MKAPTPLRAALVAALAGLVLTACQRQAAPTTAPAPDATVGQKLDKAIDRTQEELAKAGEKMKPALEKAGNSLEKAGEKMVEAAKNVSATDLGITTAVRAAFVKDPDVRALEVDVDTQDGVVTLSGYARSEAHKAKAQQLAAATQGVKSVNNKVQVTQR